MKLRIKLPDIVIDVPDVTKEDEAKNLAEDYARFIKRYLFSVSWSKFCRDKYPWLTNKATLKEHKKEKDADNWRQLKPSNGEQVSDLLRHVANKLTRAAKLYDRK